MKIHWGVRFIPHIREKGARSAAIRMRVTMRGRTPLDFPTGYRVELSQWDAARERARAGAREADGLNRTIDEWRAIVNDIFARYEIIEKRAPAPEEVRELFDDMAGRARADAPQREADFFKVFDLFTRTMGARNQWTMATFGKFSSIRRHLRAFDKGLTFPELTERKMQAYLTYLNRRGMKNTTIAKHISFVRWFLRWAAANEYYHGHLHETFRPKLKGTDGNAREVIYLTDGDMEKMREYKFAQNEKYLERVRDVLLFCCFTGLRYSDVANLRRDDVRDGCIHVVTQKTSDGLRIELNRHSRAILAKYEGESYIDGRALPVISNVKMNEYLKELGRRVGIDEPVRIVSFRGNQRMEQVFPKWQLLTTHCGRRTFVVTALRLGIPSEVIMKWTGHSAFSAMRPYVKIVDELKEREMGKFDSI